jgi:hypothetical protein
VPIHQDPPDEQGANGMPQLTEAGPTEGEVLQWPNTAHLASNLIRVTSGFSYVFFSFLSISILSASPYTIIFEIYINFESMWIIAPIPRVMRVFRVQEGRSCATTAVIQKPISYLCINQSSLRRAKIVVSRFLIPLKHCVTFVPLKLGKAVILNKQAIQQIRIRKSKIENRKCPQKEIERNKNKIKVKHRIADCFHHPNPFLF